MSATTPLWGAPDWGLTAGLLFAVAIILLIWAYWRAPSTPGVSLVAGTLKLFGFGALLLCLVEPLLSGLRPRPGANILPLVADNSQSLQIQDHNDRLNRGERFKDMLVPAASWQTRLGQEFDVRRYLFSAELRAIDQFSELTFAGGSTNLGATLASLGQRFRGLPVAGIMLFTDGNSTDEIPPDFSWEDLPPIYPIVLGNDRISPDINLTQVSVSQTNFEAAPVVVRADVTAVGYDGQSLVARIYDEDEQEIESQKAPVSTQTESTSFRFNLKPLKSGVTFYRVRVLAEEDDLATADAARENPADAIDSQEATWANNQRTVVVDRGGGPYRVLYVCGRPNWEFKFLRRALASDDQLNLVGMVRIARREPKFTFRQRGGQSTNKLFQGFDGSDEELAERYDEPVLLRLGTVNENELSDGFPQTADLLYQYDAIVLDDVEAAFFSPDQLTLIEKFVSRRGGGLLMLGGAESFVEGKYRRTPLGNVLPLYLSDGPSVGNLPNAPEYRLKLTREGWLQPWTRLRKTEPLERERLAGMASFRSLNQVGHLKPGAALLAEAIDEQGKSHPALVAQRFGRGRAAALLVGDLWRWKMRADDDDLEKSWRQTVRWLVADVPQRVEVEFESSPATAATTQAVTVIAQVRDAEFLPLDNATVNVRVTSTDGESLDLTAKPGNDRAGSYIATHHARPSVPYRANVTAVAPDGSAIGERQAGWIAEPAVDEFSHLRPDRDLLATIAEQTGGHLVELGELAEFAGGLSSRRMPVTEPWVRPIWHHPLFFLAIITCLTAEWGLRRWKGLA